MVVGLDFKENGEAMSEDKSVLQPLRALAFDVLRTLIKHAGQSGTFKGMFTLLINGEEKPVLIVGTAHGASHEDGSAIAVLNPDQSLHNELEAATCYGGGLLKEIVAGKCDAMIEVWFEAYVDGKAGENITQKYVCKTPQAAKYRVR
jgi:hypothetical protein